MAMKSLQKRLLTSSNLRACRDAQSSASDDAKYDSGAQVASDKLETKLENKLENKLRTAHMDTSPLESACPRWIPQRYISCISFEGRKPDSGANWLWSALPLGHSGSY